jgi:hypothetical protein
MPTWVPKATAPARISLASDFLALITGDATWDWLTPWVWVLGVRFYDTAEFCARGPGPVLDPLTIADFLTPTVGPGRLWDKLANIARDRIFGAFCEQPAVIGTAGWCTYFDGTYSASGSDGWVDYPSPYALFPATTTQIRYRTSGTLVDGGSLSLRFWSEASTHVRVDACSNDGAFHTVTIPAGARRTTIEWNGPRGDHPVTFDYDCDVGGSPAVEWTPTVQPPVIGALEPTHNTYTTIADLGAELDHQEDKLDQLRQTLAFLVQIQAAPSLAPDEVLPGPDLPVDPPVDIPVGAIAAVVTVSTIPASSNVELLDPQRYSRLGMITLGTADGWLPSIHIEHNPQMIVPLPPWAKLIRVSVYSPATATVRFLTKL